MGDEIDEYEEGDSCPLCWGPGKEFGDYPTPKYVIIHGSGFEGACEACNGWFVATQDPSLHCHWYFNDGLVEGYWDAGMHQPSFLMRTPPGGPDCHVAGGPHCLLVTSYNGHTMRIS